MDKTKKRIILATTGCLISIGIFFGTRMGIAHLQGAAVLLSEQLSASSSHAYSELVLEREARESSGKRATVDSYFLMTSDVASFLEKIEALAKNASVTLTIDSVGEETRSFVGIQTGGRGESKKTETYSAVVFTVSFEGSWDNVYRFLAILEHMPYASMVERVSLEQLGSVENKKSTWKGVVVFSVAKLQ
jgi:hypothetical protein